jgi:hypothetical protein
MYKLLALVILACAAIAHGCDWVKSDCWTGDFSRYTGMDDEALELFEAEWISHAKVCEMGPYILVSPANSDSDEVIIVNMNTNAAQIIVDPETVTLFDDSRSVLAQFSRSDDGTSFKSMTYEGYDPATDSRVSVFDIELDGKADLRIISSTDGKRRSTEQRIGSEWHQVIKQDGRYGFVVDDTFLPLSEGKSAILASQEELRKGPDG